jgi:hypothetical protein
MATNPDREAGKDPLLGTRPRIALWEARISIALAAVIVARFLGPVAVPVRPPTVTETVMNAMPGFLAAVGLAMAIGACRFGSYRIRFIAFCLMCFHASVVIAAILTAARNFNP